MKGESKSYTKPVIVRGSDNDWFVFFRYWDTDKERWKAFKLREGLNKIKEKQEKEAEFKALRKAREIWLKQGWNPITNYFPLPAMTAFQQAVLDIEALREMSFTDSLDYAYQKKYNDWSHKSRQDYASKITYLKQAAIRLGLIDFKIVELRRLHFRALLDDIRKVRGLTAAGYNTYRDYLSSLLGELEADEVLEYNPIAKIKNKETIKVKAHKPPTRDQQRLIISHIIKNNRPYYRFLAIEYGCAIRPKEICALKIKNLHRLEQEFRLYPDNKSSTKTKIERQVAIPDWVMELLSELNLHKFNPEWYIFGGRGGTGMFLPGPKRMHSNTPTGNYRRLVKAPVEEGGLGLVVTQYAFKKLSADEMVRLQRREGAQDLLELPRAQMGHANTKMTAVYTDEHLVVMRELVKAKMPKLMPED